MTDGHTDTRTDGQTDIQLPPLDKRYSPIISSICGPKKGYCGQNTTDRCWWEGTLKSSNSTEKKSQKRYCGQNPTDRCCYWGSSLEWWGGRSFHPRGRGPLRPEGREHTKHLLTHFCPPLRFCNQFLLTVPTFAVRETDVSRHNGGTSGAPLKPLRDDSALRALSSLRDVSLSDSKCCNGGHEWVKDWVPASSPTPPAYSDFKPTSCHLFLMKLVINILLCLLYRIFF